MSITTANHLKKFYILLLIVTIVIRNVAIGQDTSAVNNYNPASRISMLTCGVGDELYASFGHSAIRYKDSIHGIDEVYNYGTFDFSDPDFYQKFVLGKLDYFLSKSSYDAFIEEYVIQRRSVKEQVLILDQKDVAKVHAFLEDNLTTDKRSYKYDFIYDNCATRIRDAFPLALGSGVTYGNILREHDVTYRRAINSYIMNNHWSRVGINLIFGATVDSNMTDHTAAFLPDYLFQAFRGAQLDAVNIVGTTNTLVENKQLPSRSFNGPFWLSIVMLLLTLISYLLSGFGWLKVVMRFTILLLSGMLGIFMLFMWLGTSHHSCSENYNVLWALPTNIIMAFIGGKAKRWHKYYGLLGISLLIVSLIIHALGLQELPLMEIIPFLGALAFVYLDIYKRAVSLMVRTSSSH